jgi:hypothetical protein
VHGNAVRDAFKTFEALQGAADDVRGLLAHPGWAHVCRLLDAEVTDLDRKLDGGLLETRAEYAHLHGQRRALGAAQGIAHAIVSVADDRLRQQALKHEGTADAVPMEV